MRYKKSSHSKVKIVNRDIQAKDVLYDKLDIYNTKAKAFLTIMIDSIKNSGKANYAELKVLYQEMRKCDELCIDIAHKLAPYQSPKLESIEVKSRVEHRYVMRVPHQMKTTEDWAKATGATKATIEELTRGSTTIKPTLDVPMNENNEYEDEYLEPGMGRETRH